MRLSRKVIPLSRSSTFRQRERTARAVTPQRWKRKMTMKDKEYLCQSVSEEIIFFIIIMQLRNSFPKDSRSSF